MNDTHILAGICYMSTLHMHRVTEITQHIIYSGVISIWFKYNIYRLAYISSTKFNNINDSLMQNEYCTKMIYILLWVMSFHLLNEFTCNRCKQYISLSPKFNWISHVYIM